jgi:hypothetical protein
LENLFAIISTDLNLAQNFVFFMLLLEQMPFLEFFENFEAPKWLKIKRKHHISKRVLELILITIKGFVV